MTKAAQKDRTNSLLKKLFKYGVQAIISTVVISRGDSNLIIASLGVVSLVIALLMIWMEIYKYREYSTKEEEFYIDKNTAVILSTRKVDS